MGSEAREAFFQAKNQYNRAVDALDTIRRDVLELMADPTQWRELWPKGQPVSSHDYFPPHRDGKEFDPQTWPSSEKISGALIAYQDARQALERAKRALLPEERRTLIGQ